mmetsp:Transcript_20293/g.68890  ORF Transcript_20293/g.68890 Transcript_20293/m.68890 type:complete len:349 (-) Transcript_20293:986-2032(-)
MRSPTAVVVLTFALLGRAAGLSGGMLSRRRLVIGGGVAAALVGGKLYMDGPVFREDVSLAGKTTLITGGNTGLGLESAVKLAMLGSEVMIACRNETKGLAAVEAIKQRSGSESVGFVKLDLTSLDSVRACAKELKSKVPKVDVLMLNAGVMALPERQLTADGFERQFGTNHLGHFALTRELWDLVMKSPAPRIVTVSSAAHLFGKMDFDDLNAEKDYGPWKAYGQSKLSNVLFAKELARRMKAAGRDNAVSVSLHPGGVRTELGRYLDVPVALIAVLAVPLIYFTKSPFAGAQTQIFLSASQSITPSQSGLYYDNSRPDKVSSLAESEEDAARLWAASEALTGGKFNV